MKKTLLLLLTLSFPFTVAAQIFDEYKLALSTNFQDVNSNNDHKWFNDIRRSGTGFGIGFFAQKSLSSKFSVETGIEIASKRTILDLEPSEIRTIENQEGTGEFIEISDATTSLYLLSIPFKFQYLIVGDFQINSGVLVDYKLGNKTDSYEWVYEGNNISQEDNLFDFAETLNLGYLVGIGKEFSFNNREITIEVQFRKDITEMVRDDNFIPIRKQSIEFWIGLPIF